jgi:hypothetical protein
MSYGRQIRCLVICGDERQVTTVAVHDVEALSATRKFRANGEVKDPTGGIVAGPRL